MSGTAKSVSNAQQQTNSTYPIPYLCGGIFMSLLVAAKNETESIYEMFRFFVGIFKNEPKYTPYKETFSKDISNYRSCKINRSIYIPFDDPALISVFDDRVKNKNSDIIREMSEFTLKFISETKLEWLVKVIIDIIIKDEQISSSVEFYIGNYSTEKTHILSNSQAIKKDELCQLTKVESHTFLLGIFHYIIMNRPQNINGISTFEALHKNAGKRNEWVLKDTILGSTVQHIYVQVTEVASISKQFDEYIRNALVKYSMVKTMLYISQPRKFREFYVPNNIQCLDSEGRTYESATTDELTTLSRFIIIEGVGGVGKSMFMRHLLLNALDRFEETGKLPVFVSLKEYTTDTEDILQFIFHKLSDLWKDATISEVEKQLTAGNMIILFDGLDEIRTVALLKFQSHLESFVDRYSNNVFIISSRPFTSFAAFGRFTVIRLMPFTKEQAITLIKNLEFMKETPSVKENFIKELDARLYDSHRQFADNPLLLTLMLITYRRFAEIPEKMHIFYLEAYLTLAQTHDASKGGFKREYASGSPTMTGLGAFDFADYLSEFCFRTYADMRYDLSESLFDSYFDQLKQHAKHSVKIRAEDFRYDLIVNLCLMYRENDSLHFIHRSFQEFFCARCISKQMDEDIYVLADYAFGGTNVLRRMLGDFGFSMLYDMIPEKMDRYVFLPFLNKFFSEIENGHQISKEYLDLAKQRGSECRYWIFLKRIYKSSLLYIDPKNKDNKYYFTLPDIYLFPYRFMITKKNIDIGVRCNEDIAGKLMMTYGSLDAEKILRKPTEYEKEIRYIENSDCPLKREYNSVRRYWQMLVDCYVNNKRESPLDRLR